MANKIEMQDSQDPQVTDGSQEWDLNDRRSRSTTADIPIKIQGRHKGNPNAPGLLILKDPHGPEIATRAHETNALKIEIHTA